MTAGCCKQVMEVFQEMVYKGCERSVITYSSLISACEKARAHNFIPASASQRNNRDPKHNCPALLLGAVACHVGCHASHLVQMHACNQGPSCGSACTLAWVWHAWLSVQEHVGCKALGMSGLWGLVKSMTHAGLCLPACGMHASCGQSAPHGVHGVA